MDAVDELLRPISFARPTCRGVSAFGIRSFGVRSTSPRPAPGGWVRTSVAPRRSRSEGHGRGARTSRRAVGARVTSRQSGSCARQENRL